MPHSVWLARTIVCEGVALEQCLIGLEERGAPLPSAAQPVLARAVTGLHAMTARLRAREAFTVADEAESAEIAAELEALRHEATPETAIEDSESMAQRAAAADEEGQLLAAAGEEAQFGAAPDIDQP